MIMIEVEDFLFQIHSITVNIFVLESNLIDMHNIGMYNHAVRHFSR